MPACHLVESPTTFDGMCHLFRIDAWPVVFNTQLAFIGGSAAIDLNTPARITRGIFDERTGEFEQVLGGDGNAQGIGYIHLEDQLLTELGTLDYAHDGIDQRQGGDACNG